MENNSMFKWGVVILLGAIFASFVNKAGEAFTNLVVQIGVCDQNNYTCHWAVNIGISALFLLTLYLYDKVSVKTFLENWEGWSQRKISLYPAKYKDPYLDLWIQNKIPKCDEILIDEAEVEHSEAPFVSVLSARRDVGLLPNKKITTRFIKQNSDNTFSIIDHSPPYEGRVLPRYGVGKHGFTLNIEYRIMDYKTSRRDPSIKTSYKVLVNFKGNHKFEIKIKQDYKYNRVRAMTNGV